MANGRAVGPNTLLACAIQQWDSVVAGILPPRMSTAQRVAIPAPVNGLIVYDATLHKLFQYQNGAWVQVGGTANQLNLAIQDLTISGDQNNYAGFANYTANRVSIGAFGLNMTGISAESDGALKIIHNYGSYPIIFKHESGSSTAANRIYTGYSGLDLILRSLQTVMLQYDGTTSRWRVVATTGEHDVTSSVLLLKKTTDPGSDGIYPRVWADSKGRLAFTNVAGGVQPIIIRNTNVTSGLSDGGSYPWTAQDPDDIQHLNNTTLFATFTINQAYYVTYPPQDRTIVTFISRAGITALTINFSPLVVTPGGTSASWTGTLAAGVAQRFQWIESTGAWWPL